MQRGTRPVSRNFTPRGGLLQWRPSPVQLGRFAFHGPMIRSGFDTGRCIFASRTWLGRLAVRQMIRSHPRECRRRPRDLHGWGAFFSCHQASLESRTVLLSHHRPLASSADRCNGAEVPSGRGAYFQADRLQHAAPGCRTHCCVQTHERGHCRATLMMEFRLEGNTDWRLQS